VINGGTSATGGRISVVRACEGMRVLLRVCDGL
jgi:hypothetical protein